LRLLAGAAALVLGHVGAHHDRQAITGVARHVTQRGLERVHAAQAGVLELGDFHMTREPRATQRFQSAIDHAAHDHRARRVVSA
jgi:hypothetical protein